MQCAGEATPQSIHRARLVAIGKRGGDPLPELSQGLPELRQSLPELTQTSQSSPKAPPDPPTGSPRASPSYAALWGGSGEVRARFDYKNMWFSHNLELVTGATGAAGATGASEVVARPAGRTPPSHMRRGPG